MKVAKKSWELGLEKRKENEMATTTAVVFIASGRIIASNNGRGKALQLHPCCHF